MSVIELSKSIVRGATPAPVSASFLAGEPNSEPRVLKVLIVDGCTVSGALTEAVVRHMSRFEPHITRVTTPRAARFAVAADQFDAVIVDYSLEDACGLELLPDVTKNGTTAGILVADRLTVRITREAGAQGAVACFAKDKLSPKSIEAAVLGARAHS